MDLRQAKKILDKINRLYDTMTMDDDAPDVFEKDLMLSYIRQLYAAIGEGEEVLPEPPPPARASTAVTPPAVEKMEATPTPPVSEPAPEPDPEPEQEEEIIIPEMTVEPEPAAEVAPPPPPAPEPIIKQTPPVVEEKLEEPRPSAAQTTEEHESLFEQKEASELSEKLSQRPIKDIFKAMSINERVFTLNELFNGDKSAFDLALDRLNGFSHFEEAKVYLTYEVAGRFDWLHPSKQKKAKNFIKLVRRRYK